MEQKQRVIVYIDGFNFYFGLKSNAKWKKYYWHLVNNWKENPVMKTERNSGYVSYAIRAVRNNGRAFLTHINNALNSNKLLYRDAYRLTGLKGETYLSVVKSNYFLEV